MVDGTTVENVVLWDKELTDGYDGSGEAGQAAPWVPPDGVLMVELDETSPVGPGWGYDGTDFTAPTTVAMIDTVAE